MKQQQQIKQHKQTVQQLSKDQFRFKIIYTENKFIQPNQPILFHLNQFNMFKNSYARFYIDLFIQKLNQTIRYANQQSIKQQQTKLTQYLINQLKQLQNLIQKHQNYIQLLHEIYQFNWFQSFEKQEAVIELNTYFIHSFGSERQDYGTGHELNYFCYICCLARLDFIQNELTLYQVYEYVLPLYYEIIQNIIKQYHLEPAGGMGAFNVDDYILGPYLFSSAEFIRENYTTIDLYKLIEEREDSLYAKQIRFSCELKNKQIKHATQMLWEIHQVQNTSFEKINDGLIKLYQETVFDRWPVIQHFYFGNLLSFQQRN